MIITNRVVSPDVSALLPNVMIDYIWTLALPNESCAYGNQIFTLEPVQLGWQNIQEIHCLDIRRRVFGVEPIQCKIRVLKSEDSYQMSLVQNI